ncbi:RtcB family protein [Nanoarchaeota archaeon]
MKDKLKKLTNYKFIVEKEGPMKVPVVFYVNEKLLKNLEDKTVQQGMNMATLPGIKKQAIAMSDAHMGYGFPVGGVAALDAENGVISPGGIGFDINCGVRLLGTKLMKEDVEPKITELLEEMFRNVPCGVGKEGNLRLTHEELDEVLEQGPEWLVAKGFGNKKDLENCEANGHLEHADASKVSQRAKSRGRKQIGTLGAGNHFIEVQFIDEIYDVKAAKTMGLEKQGQIVVMIHSGSRGLGHQVCTDYLRRMEESFPEIMAKLPDKDLAYAPINSELAKDYFGAMCAAAHFAWCNRHLLGHQVKKSFEKLLGVKDVWTVYDVAHNIAKLEEYDIDGKMEKVYVHRKGATRAFPPGHPELPEIYKEIGQPVLIPGSMGTASYVLVGTEKAMQESFGSTCHGAGRVMSRRAANQKWKGEDVKKDLEKNSIYIKSASWRGVSEEAPGAYKDVDEVIKVVQDAGIAKAVVRLRPLGVIKG